MICESCGRKMQIGHGHGGLGPFFYCANAACEPKFFKFSDPEVRNLPDEDE